MYPELLTITKPNDLQNCIFYSEKRYNQHFLESLIQFYKSYFEIEPLVVVPKCVNDFDGSLEALEQMKINKIVIFAYADILFNDLIKINKRRLGTIIKNCCKKALKVIILSITTLKSLELPILESFSLQCLPSQLSFKNINISAFDLIDPDLEQFQSNVESFVEMIPRNKSVYISLNISTQKLLYIESKLKENGHIVHRKERKSEQNAPNSPVIDNAPVIVLNSLKTTQKLFLKNEYHIYIFAFPDDLERLDLLYYFKDILTKTTEELYIESSCSEYTEKCLMGLYKEKYNIPFIQDSKDLYDSVESMKLSIEPVYASEQWYRFEAPDTIQNMDLKNLQKKDYDAIRKFVLLKLKCKFDLDIKTCQLSCPCSPKDRSRKLNSLSNKISSIDYRCDVTCEIFNDYTIGVIIWTEQFASKEKINYSKNEIFVYQTTSGKWKFTKVYKLYLPQDIPLPVE